MIDGRHTNLFVHVEEPSMVAALEVLLPKLILDPMTSFRIIDHGSKQKLLRDLPDRLRAYVRQGDPDLKVMVLVDRDGDCCRQLKSRLEAVARMAGFTTKTAAVDDAPFRLVNRIVVEELEAWFIGDGIALTAAFPGVPITLERKAKFRDPDAIVGGTWEALHQVLKDSGHYVRLDRLPKIDVARRVAGHMVPDRNRSASFRHFRSGLSALLQDPAMS